MCGPGSAGVAHKLCARKMLMIDQVTHVMPRGGAHGLGLLIGEKFLERVFEWKVRFFVSLSREKRKRRLFFSRSLVRRARRKARARLGRTRRPVMTKLSSSYH